VSTAAIEAVTAFTTGVGSNGKICGGLKEISAVAPLKESSGAGNFAALLTNKRFSNASSDEALLAPFVVLTADAAAAAIAGAKGMVKIAKERIPTRRTLKKPGEGPGDKRFINSPYKSCHQPPRGATLLGNGVVSKVFDGTAFGESG
jgi:hypothetical protein